MRYRPGVASVGISHSSGGTQRPRAWVDGIEFVGNVGNTVLHGVRGDLTDRGARWAVTGVQVAGVVGSALLRRRYPRTQSPDARLVSTVMKDARQRGEAHTAELRRDPAFRAAQARLNRQSAWMLVYGISTLVAHRLLLADLKRRAVRRPHLIAGVALAITQCTYRAATLVAESQRWRATT